MSLRDNMTTYGPWVGAVVAIGVGYLVVRSLKKKNSGVVNPSVDKGNPKIVTSVDIEDLGNKAVFCRCWRSKKFPYCDGSHNKHNDECGDNVGPLIVKRKEA
uniref:Putative salivary secreted peptide n=1 Tax=Ornithodoros turicata TaxID=34597 RepID=A0A2R5LJZ6_9ACAR